MHVDNSKRQRCEIWTRVCGYHRPKTRYNLGKKKEHSDMIKYSEEKLQHHLETLNVSKD